MISFYLQLSQFVFNKKIMQFKRMISLELESIYMQPIILYYLSSFQIQIDVKTIIIGHVLNNKYD